MSATIDDDFTASLRDVNQRLLLSSLHEQESADAARRESAQLQALIDALHEGVILTDLDGRVISMNPLARTLLGPAAAAAAAVGAGSAWALDLRNLDDTVVAEAQRPLQRALRGEEFADWELILQRATGERRRLMVSGRTIARSGDEPLAVVVLRDVTERRQLEARLAQSEKMAALGQLSAGMAHEINTPLAYALGNVEFVLERLPNVQTSNGAAGGDDAVAIAARLGELREALVEAREGCTRVRHIVDNVRQLGAAEVQDASSVDLVPVLESVLRMTSNYVRHLAVVRRAFGAVPPVRANANLLVQVFSNLLVNAADAAAAGANGAPDGVGEIVVSTSTDDAGRAVVEVRDSGPGIAADLQSRIFDPFFTTKPVGKGTGLGLSICFSIVQSLGGQLSVESEPGKGATFRVELAPALVAPAPVSPISIPIHQVRRSRVLVIDDEPAMGRVMKRLVEADHDVVVLSDAREALERLASGEVFDAILCDVMMPGLDGPGFFEQLQRRDAELAKRVVFVSGGAFSPRAADFLASVPNTKLMKPFDAVQLRALIHALVSQGPRHRGGDE